MKREAENSLLMVTVRSKDDREFNHIRDAISMIRGVTRVELSDFPVMTPATHEEILTFYLDELATRNTPNFVEGNWIRERLPSLTRYQLRDLVKDGIVDPGIDYPGYGRRRFTKDAAARIGYLWLLHEQGYSPKVATSIIDQGLPKKWPKMRRAS